jgi:hypothetical protein
MGCVPSPTHTPGPSVSLQPQNRTALCDCKILIGSLDSLLGLTGLYFDFPDIVNIYHRFSVYVGDVAPDRVETPLPAALLLLRDVIAFAETICLPGGFLALTVSLVPLLRPSGLASYCYKVQLPFFWFGLLSP